MLLTLTLLSLLPATHAFQGPPNVERWHIFQLNLTASIAGLDNPFEAPLEASFILEGGNSTVRVFGFYDGGEQFRVRFAPPQVGTWQYETKSSVLALHGVKGTVVATKPGPDNHGPVEARGVGLYYADGTPHYSVGTTCYQWASKEFATQEATLRTLAESGFNKIRMTIFPKWYVFNHANPVQAGCAYEAKPGSPATNASAWGCVGSHCPSLAGSFDLARPNVTFWQRYELLLSRLQRLGIVADVILFHPYDDGHWGFDCLGGRDADRYDTAADKRYLRYMAARLSAFSNVWWSMANEWSINKCKGRGVVGGDRVPGRETASPVWDELFETLRDADAYGRQASIHNGALLYNHSRPWITHVSLQGRENDTAALRAHYAKPTLWDEVRYEGNLTCCGWGRLSGEAMADRFWWALSLGVHAGHSETILRADLGDDDDAQPLWWAKGGQLIGASPPRIAWARQWLRTSLTEKGLDFGAMRPSLLPAPAGAGGAACAPTGPHELRGEARAAAGGTAAATAGAADAPPRCWAAVLGDPKGELYLVHFLRPGAWDVPLPAASHAWRVHELDYWGMRETGLAELPPNASHASVRVTELPFNVVIRKDTL